MKLFQFILYVADQNRSTDFYSRLLQKDPVLNVPGMTEFELSPTSKLGIMPEKGIAAIIADKTPHPAIGNGIPRCEIYIVVDAITPYYQRAVALDALLVSDRMERDWGHLACYFSDPDGHIVAFAQEL